MMNTEAVTADTCCASCGIAQGQGDDIQLKKCACDLVKYCSVGCQKNDRPKHKKLCRKRLAEIRDDNLFKQPDESCLGDCSICCLPLPLDQGKSTIKSCCCKLICNGCDHANLLREREEGLEHKCPYCREPVPDTQEEAKQHMMTRIEANDPNALREFGKYSYDEEDYDNAFQYFMKAAELGDIESHYELSHLYRKGQGVEKNEKRGVYHLEEAAIGGYPYARFKLGCHEGRNGKIGRSTRHFIIAAKQGHDDALEGVKKGFAAGLVSKEDYAAALRGHQASVDATKSKQREEAYASGAELHDKKLFEQPNISHLGECPICCLPLSIDLSKSILMSCCCKTICNGCQYANLKREREQGLEHRCAFCREQLPKNSGEEALKQVMERIKKNDPAAMTQMGARHKMEGNYGKALEYWTKAAELGDVDARCRLGLLYYNGIGVEKDGPRGKHHLEQAAIGGHPDARGILATHEMNNGRVERAARHYIIAANLGHDISLKDIKDLFVKGIVSNDHYAAALRGHQAAVDATKSAERENAEKATKNGLSKSFNGKGFAI